MKDKPRIYDSSTNKPFLSNIYAKAQIADFSYNKNQTALNFTEQIRFDKTFRNKFKKMLVRDTEKCY